MQLTDTEPAAGCRPNFEGKVQRNYLKDYCNSDVGRLPWQDKIVNFSVIHEQSALIEYSFEHLSCLCLNT